MLQTTAQRFGSTGKSFVSPSAAAAIIGAALIASGTTDEAETEWSPAAACLLPDVLPVAGTLLSYGGDRQLAAGGTVTHSGALNISGTVDATSFRKTGTTTQALQPADGIWYIDGTGGFRYRDTGSGYATTFQVSNAGSVTCAAITASGDITLAASQRLFVSNGSTTGNYLLSGATAVFTTNSVAQGGWNSGGMYARRLFIDYVNADICLARASASNLGVYAADGTTPAAITCGAITASGNLLINSPYGSSIPQATIRGTGSISMLRLQTSDTGSTINDGFGIEVSINNAYVWNYENGPIIFGTNNTTRLTLAASGGATFTGDVTLSAGVLSLSNDRRIICGAAGSPLRFIYTNAADAAISCAAITASGDLQVNSVVRLWNSFGFGVLNFDGTQGGTTFAIGGAAGGATYLNRPTGQSLLICEGGSSTVQVTVATGGAITATSSIQETPTQSALDPTTTNIPSGKRQGWYNSTLSEFRDWVNIGGTLLKSAAYT